MKNNFREIFTCYDCEYEVNDEEYSYCNLDNSAPDKWWEWENKNWRDQHFIANSKMKETKICDDFEEPI